LKRASGIRGIDESICSFGEEDIVVDAGSGSGPYLMALSARGSLVCAIDRNLGFLRDTRSRIDCDNVVLITADLRRVPIKSECVDKIVCLEVLEHVEAPAGIVSELYRILKVKGICVVAMPTFQSETLYSRLNRNYDHNKGEHVTILKRDEWVSLLRDAGFTLLRVRNENFGPALHWLFRSMFPIDWDPSSGVFLERRRIDKLFTRGVPTANKYTLGTVNRIGNRVFPKSWYFYLMKPSGA
jgi:ubiquinone/menaquinone biosynthesis C-methylase UbiE